MRIAFSDDGESGEGKAILHIYQSIISGCVLRLPHRHLFRHYHLLPRLSIHPITVIGKFRATVSEKKKKNNRHTFFATKYERTSDRSCSRFIVCSNLGYISSRKNCRGTFREDARTFSIVVHIVVTCAQNTSPPRTVRN